MPQIKVVNMAALSFSGTTWLNLLLGSHPQAMSIGPPARLWGLRNDGFEGACLVHGKNCEFWAGFDKFWDRIDNFFVALSEFSGRNVFLMDNAPEDFLKETCKHASVQVINGRYLRDARAITASYARKMAHTNISYIESIQPESWFYHSFTNLPNLDEMQKVNEFVVRYEDAVRDQNAFLTLAGKCLGLDYDDSTYRFWESDHHITTGNQGPIAMVKLHQGQAVGDFESKVLYQSQLEKLKNNPTEAFQDERWKTQLTREDLQAFDDLLGSKNAQLGYQRDILSSDQNILSKLTLFFKKASYRAKHVSKKPVVAIVRTVKKFTQN